MWSFLLSPFWGVISVLLRRMAQGPWVSSSSAALVMCSCLTSGALHRLPAVYFSPRCVSWNINHVYFRVAQNMGGEELYTFTRLSSLSLSVSPSFPLTQARMYHQSRPHSQRLDTSYQNGIFPPCDFIHRRMRTLAWRSSENEYKIHWK